MEGRKYWFTWQLQPSICGRSNSVVKRLRENPEMLKIYDDVIKDQLNKGVIESVDDNSIQEKLMHYVPHHAVVTSSKNTTKLRIVYDASTNTMKSNVSWINNCTMVTLF